MANRNYEHIAMCVLTSPNLKVGAERAGISYTTLMRYRKRDDFKAVLQETKLALFGEAMQKAQAYSLDALETLQEVHQNPALNESARVSAARSILELAIQLHSMEAIEAELAELRKAVMGNETA